MEVYNWNIKEGLSQNLKMCQMGGGFAFSVSK